MSRGFVRHRFIPFRRADIAPMLVNEGTLPPGEHEAFRNLAELLSSLYHFELHKQLEALKGAYHPFNPDRDTRLTTEVSATERAEKQGELMRTLEGVLTSANFERATQDDVEHAMKTQSIFNLSLNVRFDDFEHVLIFWRGETVRRATIKSFELMSKEIDVPTFDRVALLVKFKDEAHFKKRKQEKFTPGSLVLKLFRNIPKADLEMLFPNAEVGMSLRDAVTLAVPSIAGGLGVFAKSGAAVFGAFSVVTLLVGSMLDGGEPRYPSSSEMAVIVGALVAVFGLGGYVVRQWGRYKSRKLAFMKTLTDNLYFRNLDNNAGVLHHLIDAAEEEECKEALIAYYFLLTASVSLSATELDARAEKWLAEKHDALVDFEVDDALRKLEELGLLIATGVAAHRTYRAVPLAAALQKLDARWDAYFDFSDPASKSA